MDLTTARDIVRQFARNSAGDNSLYSDSDIDRAIQLVGDDFVRYTRCTHVSTDLDLTEGDYDLPELPDGFSPERLISLWIPEEGILSVVTLEDIVEKQIDDPSSSDLPELVAFTQRDVNAGAYLTTGICYPTPDDDYTATLLWAAPFTSFTAGTATPDAVEMNIADEHLRVILTFGATSILQHNDIEHAYASESYKKYLEYRQSQRHVGGLGARFALRTKGD